MNCSHSAYKNNIRCNKNPINVERTQITINDNQFVGGRLQTSIERIISVQGQ